MSRCLPYTPPSVKAVNREALLEPIKLPRELEKKSKTHKKKDKRDKKDKKDRKDRKDEKEKRMKKLVEEERKVHTEDDLPTCATTWEVNAIGKNPREVESSQLEKSDITEEHKLPTVSENMCYLSDGTQSGTKRRRTIIRIKSMPKRSDPVSSHASCSKPTSSEADFETGLKLMEIVHAPSAETSVEFEKATSTSDQMTLTCEDHVEGFLYQSPIDNWVLPLLQPVPNDYGDEDWLFKTKWESCRDSKRYKASNEVLSGCTSRTYWPQALWLPEPGLSALPFTVPF